MSPWNRRSRSAAAPARALVYRPRLETLESRTVPSVVTVDRLTDNNPAGGGEGGNGMRDLRWCVIESLFQADTINSSVAGTINLAAVLPALTRSVNIEGPGSDVVTVRRDTGGNYRIFKVATDVTAAFSGLTLTNGYDDGGGISNLGTLTLSNVVVAGNSAGSSGSGGGISNSGTLTVSNSIISGNSAGIGGGIASGGILNISNTTISANAAYSNLGGGVTNSGTTTITSSTLSGNAAGFGGGICDLSTNGTLSVSNSTIAGNSSVQGGAIWNDLGMLTVSNTTIASNSATNGGGGIYVSSPMAALNTIVAGNTAPSGPDVYGNLGSQGHNLIGNPPDMTGWVETDLLHVDPMLDALQDNGGPTQTMALLPGSPAIDAGDNTNAPDWDQRGEAYPRIVNGIIDIGAFEVQDGGGSPRSQLPLAPLATVGAGVKPQTIAGIAPDQAIVRVEQANPETSTAQPARSLTTSAWAPAVTTRVAQRAVLEVLTISLTLFE